MSAPRDRWFATPAVALRRRDDGGCYLEHPQPLGALPRSLGALLDQQANRYPQRVFLQARSDDGQCHQLRFADTRQRVRAIASALLATDLGPERPLLILSGNSLAQALLTLAALYVGIPVAPLSPAYSLMSTDLSRLRELVPGLTPGLVFVETPAPYALALDALTELAPTVPVWTAADLPDASGGAGDNPAVDAAAAVVDHDTLAKILFTSGSTGSPKGVLNTQRMLLSNQVALAQLLPGLAADGAEGHLQLVDWLPWNHTFGANQNFHLPLFHGGRLLIDQGKPLGDAFAETLRNLAAVSPSFYANVPRGFELLVPALERDQALARQFFHQLRVIFFAGAAMPAALWQRLNRLGEQVRGAPVPLISGWGATETAPACTVVHWPAERPDLIGNPLPGTTLKLLPSDAGWEVRVKGPNVTPGYWRDAEATAAAFDDEGFYRIGDAVRFADPERPEAGLCFAGRVAENFKLTSGTWVHTGQLRPQLVSALAPWVSDAVLTAPNRPALGALLFLNAEACAEQCGDSEPRPLAEYAEDARVHAALAAALADYNAQAGGGSRQVQRALLLTAPPSLDAGEITDKGYLNQQRVLAQRSMEVDALYAETPLARRLLPAG